LLFSVKQPSFAQLEESHERWMQQPLGTLIWDGCADGYAKCCGLGTTLIELKPDIHVRNMLRGKRLAAA
jgi:hypothetical protein